MRNTDISLTINYREMQLFLLGFIIVEICEIFTVGKFPLKNTVRIVSGKEFWFRDRINLT